MLGRATWPLLLFAPAQIQKSGRASQSTVLHSREAKKAQGRCLAELPVVRLELNSARCQAA